MPELWKVRVDCLKQGPTHPMVRRFLVQADDSTAAFAIAQKLAEDTAPIGPRWIEFKAREAVTVRFPLEI